MPGPNRRSRRLKQATDLTTIDQFSSTNPTDGDLLIFDVTDGVYENGRALTGDYSVAGTLTATDLVVEDDLTVQDALTVQGNANVDGDLAIIGSSTFNNPVSVSSDLDVTGSTTLDSLDLAGSLTGVGFSFSGSGTVTGDLSVSGTITGDIAIGGDQSFDSLTLSGALTAGSVATSGSVSADAVVASSAAFDSLSAASSLDIGLELCVSGGFCLLYDPADGTDLADIVHTDDSVHIRIRGTDASATEVAMAEFDPDGPTTLFNAGSQALATAVFGVSVRSATNTSIEIANTDGTTSYGGLTYSTGDNQLSIRTAIDDGVVDISGFVSGSLNTLAVFTPGAQSDLYHNDVRALGTTSDGGASYNTDGAGFTGTFDVYNGNEAARVQVVKDGSGGGGGIRNREDSGHVYLDATDAASANQRGLEFDPDTGISFNGATPIAPPAYTPTNVTTDRSYDANSTTLDEVADVLGTLIADLQANGLLA